MKFDCPPALPGTVPAQTGASGNVSLRNCPRRGGDALSSAHRQLQLRRSARLRLLPGRLHDPRPDRDTRASDDAISFHLFGRASSTHDGLKHRLWRVMDQSAESLLQFEEALQSRHLQRARTGSGASLMLNRGANSQNWRKARQPRPESDEHFESLPDLLRRRPPCAPIFAASVITCPATIESRSAVQGQQRILKLLQQFVCRRIAEMNIR